MTSGLDEQGMPDIRPALAQARRGADDPAEDGPYRELMATYAALGELLESKRSDSELVLDCRDLVGRLVKLGLWVERMGDQRWAMWMAQNTAFGGEREQ